MKTLIRDTMILPLHSPDVVFGSVAISGRRIVAVGKVPSDFIPDRVIDGAGKITMPGMVNAHTHLSMTYFRNYRDSVANLHHWLQEIWALEAHLTPQDIYPASLLGIAEMIASGTTCFSDMYFFPEETARAVAQSQIKANLGLTLFGDEKETRRRIAEYLPHLQNLQKESDGAVKIDIAPHAVYTCTPETYHIAAETAQDHACRVHTHISETAQEVTDCLTTYGKTPLMHLEHLGVCDASLYGAHGVHLTQQERILLAEKTIPIIHCPSSNSKLASGVADLFSMTQEGVPMALGTDGASSNNTLDMFKEIRLAAMLSSATTGNPQAVSAYDVLRMATLGGAQALGRECECGTIEVGKDADIILIDYDNPHMTPLNDPFSALVFSASSADVHTVICAGTVLMKDRKFTTIDIQQVIQEVNHRWKTLRQEH
jgi:5-methylthioadenosine/S-adenosylhomocysteine deaminase